MESALLVEEKRHPGLCGGVATYVHVSACVHTLAHVDDRSFVGKLKQTVDFSESGTI